MAILGQDSFYVGSTALGDFLRIDICYFDVLSEGDANITECDTSNRL